MIFVLSACTNARPSYTSTSIAPPIAINPDPRTLDSIFVGGNSITINGICEQNDQPLSLWIDGQKIEGISAQCIEGKFEMVYNTSLLGEGTHSVFVSISPTPDKILSSKELRLIKDTIAPVVTPPNLNELATDGNYTNSSLYKVEWIESDGTGSSVDHYELLVYKYSGCSSEAGKATYTGFSGNSVKTSVNYTNSYRLIAYDMAGNSATSVCSHTLYYNQKPIAVTDHIFIQQGNSDPVDFNIINNDSDPEGSALQLVSVANIGAESKLLSILANPPGNDNFVQVRAKSESRGSTTIEYVVQDNRGQTNTGLIKVHIVGRNTWIGSVSSSWSDPANWCGTVKSDHTGCNGLGLLDLPYYTQLEPVEFFDISGDCDVDTNVFLSAMVLDKDFAGIVRQNSNTMTFEPTSNAIKGFIQRGGKFEGSGTGAEIHMDVPFEIYGGIFVSTTGDLTIESHMKIKSVDSPITFNNRLSKVRVACYHGESLPEDFSRSSCDLDVDDNIRFADLDLIPLTNASVRGDIEIISNGIHVDGDLYVDSYNSNSDVFLNGGIIHAHQNVSAGSIGVEGNATLKISGGVAVTHYFSAASAGASFPNTIVNTDGSFYLSTDIVFLNNRGADQPFFIYKNGTFPPSTKKVRFLCALDKVCSIEMQNHLTLPRVEFKGEAGNIYGKLTIVDNGFKIIAQDYLHLHMHGNLPIIGGIVEARGEVFNDSCDYGVAGTVKLHLNGSVMNVHSSVGCLSSPAVFPATLVNSSGTINFTSSNYFGASILDGSQSSSEIFTFESGVIQMPSSGTLGFLCSFGLTCLIDTGGSPFSVGEGNVFLNVSSDLAGDVSSTFKLTNFKINADVIIKADRDQSKTDIIEGEIVTFKNVTISDEEISTNIYFNNPIKLFFAGTANIIFSLDNLNVFPSYSVLDYGKLDSTKVTISGDRAGTINSNVTMKNDTSTNIPDISSTTAY